MKKQARQSMTRHLVTINWSETMETARARMQRHRCRHLPVLNDMGQVVGMLSDRDVQRSMISQVKHEYTGAVASESAKFDPEAKVRDYMGWPVLSVEHDADLREVAQRMLREKVSSFIVKNGGNIIGIITSDDLLKVLVDLLKDPKTPLRWTLQEILGDAATLDAVLI